MPEERLQDLQEERDRLVARAQELETVTHHLHHELYLRNQDLEAIRASKMWRSWMLYHACRRAVTEMPSRAAHLVKRSLLGLARLTARLYLLVLVPALFLRARLRAAIRSEEGFATFEKRSGEGDEVRTRSLRRPRVLMVTPLAIYPPDHGSGVRHFNLVKNLSRLCELSLLIFSPRGEDPEQRTALEPYCRSVDFHHWVPQLKPGRYHLPPPNAQIFSSDEAYRRIHELAFRYDIDVLQLEHTELGQYQSAAPPNVKVILSEIDIAFRSLGRRRQLGFDKRFPEGRSFGNTRTDWRRLVRYELNVCHGPDQIFVMSAADGAYLAHFLADGRTRVRVMPNGVDTSHYKPVPDQEREGVLLVGNFQNLPNVDGLEYLAAEIWPLLHARLPQVTLTVVGAEATERVYRFDGRYGISVVGAVPDLKPYYLSHRVLAAPIRAGSGTRLKLLEAFAAGLPAVSTTIGAEGIACEDGRHILIADTPERFAAALERLLSDDELAARIARNARTLACETYDWRQVAASMVSSYEELLGSRLEESPDPAEETLESQQGRNRPDEEEHEAQAREATSADKPSLPTSAEEDGAAEVASEEVPAAEELRPRVTETITLGPKTNGSLEKVLVMGIYLAHRPNYVEDIVRVLGETEQFEVHQSWVALLGEPPSEEVARVTVRRLQEKTPKCAILNDLLAEKDLGRYEYVVVCDDDVALPERFLDQYLTLQTRLGFSVAQPARTVNSYIDLPIVEQHPGVLARETLFVEQGPVISFHRSAFCFAFPFDMTSPMGWGLENVWSLEVTRHGLSMGILDNVPVDHSMRKTVANYTWHEAARGRTALFAKADHRPNEECFKVLRLLPLERSRR